MTDDQRFPSSRPAAPPPSQGLYDPQDERDACGVGFVVDMKGRRSHGIVSQALQVLKNLEHRGACGCEVNTGDGAGILVQMPDAFFRQTGPAGLPPEGEYGAGLVFLPHDAAAREAIEALFGHVVAEEGQRLVGWRDVPTDHSPVGPSAVGAEPVFRQVFVGRGPGFDGSAPDARLRFERKLYVIRKRMEHAVDRLPLPDPVRKAFYVVSLSATTLIFTDSAACAVNAAGASAAATSAGIASFLS
jgi:glutamate synthase (ferredoxin)